MYPSMNQFNDWIWIGPAGCACDPGKLRRHGVTAVANLTGIPMGAAAQGFKELVIEQEDGEWIPHRNIQMFLDWMEARELEGDIVLVHCAAGISRTPSFLIAFLMHKVCAYGDVDHRTIWSRFQDQIERVRPIIQPHHQLKKSVLTFFAFERKH